MNNNECKIQIIKNPHEIHYGSEAIIIKDECHIIGGTRHIKYNTKTQNANHT